MDFFETYHDIGKTSTKVCLLTNGADGSPANH